MEPILTNVALCSNAEGQVVNIGTGKEWSIKETAEMLCTISGQHVEILSAEDRIRPKKSEVNRLLADNTKLQELTGWKAEIKFEEGLKRTYSWIKKNIQYFDVDNYAK